MNAITLSDATIPSEGSLIHYCGQAYGPDARGDWDNGDKSMIACRVLVTQHTFMPQWDNPVGFFARVSENGMDADEVYIANVDAGSFSLAVDVAS